MTVVISDQQCCARVGRRISGESLNIKLFSDEEKKATNFDVALTFGLFEK